MSTVEEIEAAIQNLPRGEARRLAEWLNEWMSDEWDRQIDEDARTGKLHDLYDRLQAEENKGEPEAPLDSFLDDQKLS